ncbi:MAG: hypothetical protein ACYC35_17035 [Pirellulales bacterium]
MLLSLQTFRVDSGGELDSYQFKDNPIAFDINVHDIAVAAIESATLTMAVYDVDYDPGFYPPERDEVYVNGHRLMTPVSYLTGANNQWSTVTFNVEPEWIVDGNNRVDIIIDVLNDGWAVSCDWAELRLEVGDTPEVEDILIDANPATTAIDSNPTTTKDVKFTAKLKNMAGYEIVKIAWTSDAFSPLSTTTAEATVKPMAGEHGNDKDITAILTYRKVGETQTYTAKAYSEKFDLFFDKTGDEDTNGQPNWFDYWNQLNVGDRQGITDVRYDGGMSGADGQYTPGSSHIRIGPGAAGQDYKPPGTCIIGIDNFAQTLTHESYHYHQWITYWNKTWASYLADNKGKTGPNDDLDGDLLPNRVEDTNLNGVFDSSTETYDVTQARTSGNPWSGLAADLEWQAHTATDSNRGPHSLDWANPGKQTSPPEPDPWVPDERADLVVPDHQGAAVFTGSHADYGVDSDGDSLYNAIAVDLEMAVAIDGQYLVTAGLQDSAGNMTWASQLVSLAAGVQNAHLEFAGPAIRQHQVAGPYHVVLLNCYDAAGDLVDYSDGGLVTGS